MSARAISLTESSGRKCSAQAQFKEVVQGHEHLPRVPMISFLSIAYSLLDYYTPTLYTFATLENRHTIVHNSMQLSIVSGNCAHFVVLPKWISTLPPGGPFQINNGPCFSSSSICIFCTDSFANILPPIKRINLVNLSQRTTPAPSSPSLQPSTARFKRQSTRQLICSRSVYNPFTCLRHLKITHQHISTSAIATHRAPVPARRKTKDSTPEHHTFCTAPCQISEAVHAMVAPTFSEAPATETQLVSKPPMASSFKIQTLSLEDFDNLKTRPRFLQDMRESLMRIGTFYIKDHGISTTITSDVMTVIREYFALPLEEKKKMHIANSRHFRGYKLMGKRASPPRRPLSLPPLQPWFDCFRESGTLSNRDPSFFFSFPPFLIHAGSRSIESLPQTTIASHSTHFASLH